MAIADLCEKKCGRRKVTKEGMGGSGEEPGPARKDQSNVNGRRVASFPRGRRVKEESEDYPNRSCPDLYRNPALGQRPVIRLASDRLGEAEDLAKGSSALETGEGERREGRTR